MPARSPLNQPDMAPEWAVKMQMLAAEMVGSKYGLTGEQVIEVMAKFQKTIETFQLQVHKEQNHASAKAVEAMQEMWERGAQTPAADRERAKDKLITPDPVPEPDSEPLGNEGELLPDPDLDDEEEPDPGVHTAKQPEDVGIRGSLQIPKPRPVRDNPQA